MTEQTDSDRWNQRYHDGDLPWDRKTSCPHLADIVADLDFHLPDSQPNPAALEVGCGTGTNSIYLAKQGFTVTAVDIAPRAIELAVEKADRSFVKTIDFKTCDITQSLPVAPHSVQFVYDRGCFHSVDPANRPTFANRVSEALADTGYWLSLCGNADEHRAPDTVGPPQLTAADIITAVESLFHIIELKRVYFTNEDNTSHMAWRCLMQKR